jgi:aryl-alcohol dehydrogenase-like predicted oxidoreductase
MMISRRSFLGLGFSSGAALLVDRLPLLAQLARQPLIRRAIPRSGELLPVIGLGSVGTFNLTPRSAGYAEGQEVIRLFSALGGRVIDTAPGYGNSEGFIGETIGDLGIGDEVFLATKFNALQISAGFNVRPSGGEAADRAEMERQMESSLGVLGRRRLDLQQVWNLGDTQANAQRSSRPAGHLRGHIDQALEWKRAGRTRYVGITTSRRLQYLEAEEALSRYPIDFIQLDFSIEDPEAEERLLPAALDNGVAVLVNRPFGSGSLFRIAAQRGKALPPWAPELGIETWAQFFLKFIVSHPAVTAAIPATSNPRNLRDNMGAGLGSLPDPATRRRMLAYWRV